MLRKYLAILITIKAINKQLKEDGTTNNAHHQSVIKRSEIAAEVLPRGLAEMRAIEIIIDKAPNNRKGSAQLRKAEKMINNLFKSEQPAEATPDKSKVLEKNAPSKGDRLKVYNAILKSKPASRTLRDLLKRKGQLTAHREEDWLYIKQPYRRQLRLL